MKLHVLSDLHIDQTGFPLPNTHADVLVMAGNIGPGAGGLAWLYGQQLARPVVYVPGLLEFSAGGFDVFDGLVSAARDNVLLLQDDAVVVGGVRFIGALLWTDASLLDDAEACFTTRPVGRSLFNADLLREDLRIRTPADSRQLHRQSRARLQQMLATPFTGKTVVITHHALASASLRPRFGRHRLTRSFVSRLGPIPGVERSALWLHGNIHEAFDDVLGGTRMVCNPRGDVQMGSAKGFKPDLVVEI